MASEDLIDNPQWYKDIVTDNKKAQRERLTELIDVVYRDDDKKRTAAHLKASKLGRLDVDDAVIKMCKLIRISR